MPTVEIDYNSTSLDTVHGKKIDLDVIGAKEVYAFDSLLFVETSNPESYVTVLSLGDYHYVDGLCKKGRARNEFINPQATCKQLFKENGHTMLVMADNSTSTKIIDVTESLKRQYTVVTEIKNDIANSSSRGYSVYNNLTNEWFSYKPVSYVDPRDHIYNPPSFYFSKENYEYVVPVINKMMYFPSGTDYALWIYAGDVRLKPDGSKVVFSCFFMPYIFIFDSNKHTGTAYHKKGELTFYEDYPDDDVTDIDLYYQDVCATDDFIISLCGDGKQSEYDAYKRPVVRFFNWDGECLFAFYIDQQTYVITYDEINKKVIGLNERTEEIYEYDVEDYIQ